MCNKCGETYCSGCIIETVKKFSNCPICRNQISEKDLIKNRFYSNMVEKVSKNIEENKQIVNNSHVSQQPITISASTRCKDHYSLSDKF
jgi:hypothetical protein